MAVNPRFSNVAFHSESKEGGDEVCHPSVLTEALRHLDSITAIYTTRFVERFAFQLAVESKASIKVMTRGARDDRYSRTIVDARCMDVEEKSGALERDVRRERIIALVYDNSSVWGLTAVLRATAASGTPILPILVCDASTHIGPLIIGGNAAPYLDLYADQFNVSDERDHDERAPHEHCERPWNSVELAVALGQSASILDLLPDCACLSSVAVSKNGDVSVRRVISNSKLLTNPLNGALWSISKILNCVEDDPRWVAVAQHVQQGGVATIRSAFSERIAQTLHKSMNASGKWRLFEDAHPYFSYRHHNIYNLEDLSPEMVVISMIFASRCSIEWASRIAGSDCSEGVAQSPSWYMFGDYSTPHSDDACGRKLAFVWHLTKNWQAQWGGHFFWAGGDKILPVSFNTLHLFDTRKSGRHMVMTVTPEASEKRLAWNGWFTGKRHEMDAEGGVDGGANDPIEFHGRRTIILDMLTVGKNGERG
jgi:hypothetical protein